VKRKLTRLFVKLFDLVDCSIVCPDTLISVLNDVGKVVVPHCLVALESGSEIEEMTDRDDCQ
jgi:hypothetical protein